MTELLQIDWRSLKSDVEDTIRVGSGVLHVQLEAGAPQTTFIRTLREAWVPEHWPVDQVAIVEVDPNEADTRFTHDLARKIARDCGLDDEPTPQPGGTGASNILSDIRGKSVTLNDVRVEIHNSYQDVRSSDPLDNLRRGLTKFLETRRLVVVFRDAHTLEESRRANLGRELWGKCFSRFSHAGVLLIFLYDRNSGLDVPDDTRFPPPPTKTATLCATIGLEDEQHAIDDVAQIALDRGWFPDRAGAVGFARGVVTLADDMRTLHTQVRTYGLRQNGGRK